jgi:hypothetical protein
MNLRDTDLIKFRWSAWLVRALGTAGLRAGQLALGLVDLEPNLNLEGQRKMAREWREGRTAVAPDKAFKVGELLTELGHPYASGLLAVLAAGHFKHYIRTLRALTLDEGELIHFSDAEKLARFRARQYGQGWNIATTAALNMPLVAEVDILKSTGGQPDHIIGAEYETAHAALSSSPESDQGRIKRAFWRALNKKDRLQPLPDRQTRAAAAIPYLAAAESIVSGADGLANMLWIPAAIVLDEWAKRSKWVQEHDYNPSVPVARRIFTDRIFLSDVTDPGIESEITSPPRFDLLLRNVRKAFVLNLRPTTERGDQ